ncbi:hypothetical protein QAD02_016764 [Eretmocerus hayati]|uniref:Uncharacterized protein n=1 Tax=Eretmocerus hayati TaxID=131215 RepID=A0ACC2PCE3_9HYME|nr:hypothetical protein QAD02_016764 [Eretmocerus hayati]
MWKLTRHGTYHFMISFVSSLMVFCSSLCRNVSPIDLIVNHIQEDLSVKKINFIIDSSKQISHVSGELVRKISHRIPSNTINSKELTEDRYNSKISSFDTYEEMLLERLSLVIGITYTKNDQNMNEDLSGMLESYHWLTGNMRGRYLMVVIGEKSHSLKTFLHAAWASNFLDLSVIEITGNNSNSRTNHDMLISPDYRMKIYTFNPFSSEYSVSDLNASTVIFPNKLRDLNGYKFRAEIDGYGGNGIKQSILLHSCHDKLMMQTIVESLNSTMVITNRSTPWYMNSSDIGVRYFEPFTADFYMNLYYGPIVVIVTEQGTYDLIPNLSQIVLPTTVSYYLLLKRPIQESEIEISKKAIIAYAALILTGIFFASYSRLLGFKQKNWSVLNITTAQMGGSLEYHGNTRQMKMSEKIYLITMYITTFIVTTVAADYILKIFIFHQKTDNFETLKDLADSDIPLILANSDFEFLSLFFKNPNILRILERSEKHKGSNSFSRFCYFTLPDEPVDESVNLCVWESRKDVVEIELSDNWYIDKIDEPVQVIHPRFYLDDYGHFKDTFEMLLGRFLETGIEKSWQLISQRTRISGMVGRGANLSAITENVIPLQEDLEDAMPLKYQLSAVMAVGSIFSIFVLICEIIWSRYLGKTKIGILMIAFCSHYRPQSYEMRSTMRSKSKVSPALTLSRILAVRETANLTSK